MHSRNGFTTIELLVTVAIVAILIAVAVPSFNSFVMNARIRALGESMANALTLARADAVRLNTRVAFTIDGGNWRVYRVDTGRQLHAGTGRESVQSGLQLVTTPSNASTATYDAFGRRTTLNADGSNPIVQLDVRAARTPTFGNYSPLRLQVLGSGMSRLCDPSAASTNAKACL